MPVFAYRGRGARGELVTGTLDAADASAVADQLAATGITPVDIHTAAVHIEARAPEWLKKAMAPQVSLVDLMLFSRQMYTLLKAGVPILRALAGLEESSTNPTLRAVIADLRTSLDAGRELSTAMRRHPHVFSNFYVSVVRVGEATGQLDESFDRLFSYLDFERDVRERIKTAMRYPVIVVVAIGVAVGIVNFFVIPAFARIFEASKVQLPLLTRFLVGTSDFFVGYWPFMLGLGALGFLGFMAYKASERGRFAWDRRKLRLPIAGRIIFKATLARFARALSIATKAGVPIAQGLSIVAGVVDNAFVAKRVEEMRQGVERGESVARTAAGTGIFNQVVLQMLAVGEETGEISALLGEIADMYEREVDYEIKTLAANIEPIITVALGVLVLLLALGVFLPIWEMSKVMLKR